MMNKKRSPGIVRAKYLMFIPLAGILMLLSNIEAVARLTVRLANEATTSSRMTRATGVQAADMTNHARLSLSARYERKEEQVFTVVEVMPRFPGGEAALLKYLANTIRYPEESRERGESGRVICSFVVGSDGSISRPEVLRGVSPALDREAVRVINTMPLWTPGTQQGRPVAVKYTVPITFRLRKPVEEPKEPVHTVVDVMPEYPGGASELLKFIARNVKYPHDAQQAGIQGRVICSFVVDKEGNVTEPKVERHLDPSLDAEALRVIGKMPRWTPGYHGGKRVRVLYTVPITFRLQ